MLDRQTDRNRSPGRPPNKSSQRQKNRQTDRQTDGPGGGLAVVHQIISPHLYADTELLSRRYKALRPEG